MKSYSMTTKLRDRIKERDKIPSHVLSDFRQNGVEVCQLHHESYKPILEQARIEVVSKPLNCMIAALSRLVNYMEAIYIRAAGGYAL
jgi:hypothetical protein